MSQGEVSTTYRPPLWASAENCCAMAWHLGEDEINIIILKYICLIQEFDLIILGEENQQDYTKDCDLKDRHILLLLKSQMLVTLMHILTLLRRDFFNLWFLYYSGLNNNCTWRQFVQFYIAWNKDRLKWTHFASCLP